MSARASIDGRAVAPAEGETILAAAARLGIEIPTLCFVPGLPADGACRLCLVDVAGEAHPLAACHTVLRDGMRVRTRGERLLSLRREVLALYAAHAAPAAFRADPDATPFERLLARHGVAPAEVAPLPGAQPPLEIHPLVRFEPERCIACRRCVAACESIQGQFVFAIAGRGGAVRLTAVADAEGRTDCTACGACVDLCPTGALSDVDRDGGARADARTRSVCGYCGVGCAVTIESRGERVLRIGGVADSVVNRGHLCAKGRFAHSHHGSPDRLVRPLVRERGVLRAVSWDDALDFAARRLRDLRDLHGPGALGLLTSSRSTNEAAYLLQRLFRGALGTNHVDCCARVCHASTAEALRDVTGTGAASASYADIERAQTLVVAGANPTEAHPVVGARLEQAVRRGARLVVIDPRATALAGFAHVFLRPRPGTNVPLWNALARVLVEENQVDQAYVSARCEGFAELRAFLERVSLEEAAATTSVAVPEIRAAARLLGRGPALYVWGLGLSEQSQGTDAVRGLVNLALLSGSVGRPGAGLLPLRGQNNVQGNADMGSMPDLATGYQPLSSPEVRARLAREWGAPPPAERGKTLPDMLDAAARGELRALWIQGEDVAQSDPNESHVRAALARLDFLAVQELFETETTAYAHLVLPAASALEQDGTFTNAERRIQRVRRAVPPPGEARADWEVARDLGRRLGVASDYASPAEVMDEIARVAPALFGGVAYDRLEGDGLQWPCPARDHPGTATVHAEGFLRGRARLAVLPYRPAPEQPSERFPYVLITGRVLEHYNVGTLTRRSPLAALAPADWLEVHPADAAREGIADGAHVRVESRFGAALAPARLTERVAPGQLFLSFHHPETHANRVTGSSVDPESRCPDYKVTAVRLAVDAGAGAAPAPAGRARAAASRRARPRGPA